MGRTFTPPEGPYIARSKVKEESCIANIANE